MVNRTTRDVFYDMYHEDELQHHGVKDQQWGVQNGPPYPLSGENKKAAKKFYREQRRQDRIARRQERELKKNRKFEEARQKMLSKANIKEIRRHSDWFSQQEIESAMRKRQMLDASKPSKKKQKVLEEANLKKIQKHPERYTQDEMRYAITRHQLLEEQKRTKSDEQIKKEQELNDRLAKLEKAAKIAAAASTIIGLGTAGLNFVNAYKDAKWKAEQREEDVLWKQPLTEKRIEYGKKYAEARFKSPTANKYKSALTEINEILKGSGGSNSSGGKGKSKGKGKS